MNLQESIRRILREEDFIPLEDLYTVIKDYEDGFDVFIMNKDKKIGEISFVKEDKPNQYTIVDATIDDEYKGNRIYSKTIINLFKERPNIIINSVFRSPEAEKAWKYLLSDLPSNIEHKVKYYEDEETTLYQLKLKNLQESIRRILKEEINQNTRRTDIGRDIDTFLFDDLYDNILGSAYFKFQDYDIWFDSNGEEMTDDVTNQILNTIPIQQSFRSFEEWKDSEWYYNTEFPFSNKDWSTVKSGDKESFKWHSTGHKQMEEKIFNSYLKKYGRFMVVNLTDK